MSRKRAAFVIDGLAVGGAEKFLISLVNYFQQQGYKPFVIILSRENPLLPEMDKEIEYVIVERSMKYDITVGRRIKAMLIDREIQTVFCVDTFAFFITKLYNLFDGRFRFFLSVHFTIPKSFRNFALYFIYFRTLLKRDTIIYICKMQERYLKHKYFLQRKKAALIYNGIDTTRYKVCEFEGPERQALRTKYNISPGDKVIIKVARLAKEKGHKYAIEALKILRDKYNCNAWLILVGKGDETYKEELTALAHTYNLQSQIIFTGTQQDVRPFYCLSDMVTLTSSAIETFSLAALEAMSSGRPCSLTNIGGAAEMITENTGTLSTPSNAQSIAESWFRILSGKYDPDVIHQHVENNFSAKQMLESYEALIYQSH